MARKYQRLRRLVESNAMDDRDTFVERYGPLFEHSPWVADDAWDHGPFADREALADGLERAMYEGIRMSTLDLGPGHWPGTAMPGELGNVALSGHRDSFFRPLKDIAVGDVIELQNPFGTQNFEVTDINIVDALDTSVLDPVDETVLTLITCYPFYYLGFAPDRYIVRARLIGSGTATLGQLPSELYQEGMQPKIQIGMTSR